MVQHQNRITENIGIPSILTNAKEAYTGVDKANALNNKFQSIFKENPPPPNKGPSPFHPCPTLSLEKKVIAKQLRLLKPNKATGPDELPASVLKDVAD